MGQRLIVEVTGENELQVVRQLADEAMKRTYLNPMASLYIRIEQLPENIIGKEIQVPLFMCQPCGHIVSRKEAEMGNAIAGKEGEKSGG